MEEGDRCTFNPFAIVLLVLSLVSMYIVPCTVTAACVSLSVVTLMGSTVVTDSLPMPALGCG